MTKLTQKFNKVEYEELHVNYSSGFVKFRKQQVRLSKTQAQILAHIVLLKGKKESYKDMCTIFGKSQSTMKTHISYIRKALRAITVCHDEDVQLDSIFLTDRMMTGDKKISGYISLNTKLLDKLSSGLSLGGVRTEAKSNRKNILAFQAAAARGHKDTIKYKSFAVNVDMGVVLFKEKYSTIGRTAARILELMLKNPTSILHASDISKTLRAPADRLLNNMYNLRKDLSGIDASEELTAKSFFLTDKIFSLNKRKIIARQYYLNTPLIDALESEESLGKIRVEHFGREEVEPDEEDLFLSQERNKGLIPAAGCY